MRYLYIYSKEEDSRDYSPESFNLQMLNSMYSPIVWTSYLTNKPSVIHWFSLVWTFVSSLSSVELILMRSTLTFLAQAFIMLSHIMRYIYILYIKCSFVACIQYALLQHRGYTPFGCSWGRVEVGTPHMHKHILYIPPTN